jgi:hypothetical protein
VAFHIAEALEGTGVLEEVFGVVCGEGMKAVFIAGAIDIDCH